MPLFSILSSITGGNRHSLFDIRLDQDFIVFRGGPEESSGQLLRGFVVLCLSSALRIEHVRLRLTCTRRLAWTDKRSSTAGVSGQKVDKSTVILLHRWAPFVGVHGKSMTLPAGNYEYPFEFNLPGDTPESVEGVPEASITYRLKATVGRGMLFHDLHTYKHLRVIRTFDPGALEFLLAMNVENIWPKKIDYSIIIPQKAVVFGGIINMQMRFTPLLKGLKLGEITARFIELRHCWIQGSKGLKIREHHTEREVSTWRFEVNAAEHWQDTIGDSGQEGWSLNKSLNLPKRLRQCIQDLNHHGIKVRHKIKLTVALINPDGHVSELRASLPVSIFISPNVPFDEQGNLLNHSPGATLADRDATVLAPPGYGEHVLDQLYEDVDTAGFQTPAIQSGVSSPLYAHSRTGSADNLATLTDSATITPAALSSRLADVSLDSSRRNSSYTSMNSVLSRTSPPSGPQGSAHRSEPQSASLTRSNSREDYSRRTSVEHLDAELSRVPSYATAVRTPARSWTQTGSCPVPDYRTALSAPRTQPATEFNVEHLTAIAEVAPAEQTNPEGSHSRLGLNVGRSQVV